MARTTKADLLQAEGVINKALGTTEDNAYKVEWAYGRPRLYQGMPGTHGGVKEVSPRLPMGQMLDWLYAFEAGIRAGYDVGITEAEIQED